MTTSTQSPENDEASVAGKPAPLLVLRGTRRNETQGAYDTTVLLFKAPDTAYLQGFVQIDGQKHQVIGHINKRKPNTDTGEVKANFITLSELDLATEKWREVGHGNAVNRRSDNKPVFYDEVLFNVQGETLRARLSAGVDATLQRSLGFDFPRVPRTKSQAGQSDHAESSHGHEEPKPAQQRTCNRG
jgi:hypothetical protein